MAVLVKLCINPSVLHTLSAFLCDVKPINKIMVIHCEPIRERNWKANWKFKKLDDSQNTCYILQLTLTLFTKHYFPNFQK